MRLNTLQDIINQDEQVRQGLIYCATSPLSNQVFVHGSHIAVYPDDIERLTADFKICLVKRGSRAAVLAIQSYLRKYARKSESTAMFYTTMDAIRDIFDLLRGPYLDYPGGMSVK